MIEGTSFLNVSLTSKTYNGEWAFVGKSVRYAVCGRKEAELPGALPALEARGMMAF
jgi:hypothetical protein